MAMHSVEDWVQLVHKQFNQFTFVGICATLEVILIVLVLYFLVPATGDYTDVIIHINPRKNQCKP